MQYSVLTGLAAASEHEVTREIFWLLSSGEKKLFYVLAFVSTAIFFWGIYRHLRHYLNAAADRIPRFTQLKDRMWNTAGTVGSHSTFLKGDLLGGLMHFCISWGFIVLFIATTILAIDVDIVRPIFGDAASFFHGNFYLVYSFLADVLGFLFPVGVVLALYLRYGDFSNRMWGKHTNWEDDLFIWVFFLLAVGGYGLEGIRILGEQFPSYEWASPVGWMTARGLQISGMTDAAARAWYTVAWWSHSLLALGFVSWLPFSKPFHMISGLANVLLKDEKAAQRMPEVPEGTDPEDIGYQTMDDLSWKRQLDLDACTKCGRCSDVCPANASGRPLDPRNVILDLKAQRDHPEENGEEGLPIISGESEAVIDTETMDACMSCMACMEACPVSIEHIPHFTDMNRRLVETGAMNEGMQDVMMDLFQKGNSFGKPERKRTEWMDELDLEVTDAREEEVTYLWYVGDYPSYDPRQQEVARAIARILERADVDYGILFEDEQNDGNDVRRVGEEGLFEMLVEENITQFEQCEFEKVLCTDPHSFNTFQHEYPEFDWEAKPVLHYSQLLDELLEDGTLSLQGNELDMNVTYHDPCHLGRFNDVYEPPRRVIRATGCSLHEMPRNRSNSFCCGGGGGGIWMDFDDETKPSEERLREALEDTDAGERIEKFIVTCPMCGTMYEDGRKTGDFEDEIEVMDLSELVWKAIEQEGN